MPSTWTCQNHDIETSQHVTTMTERFPNQSFQSVAVYSATDMSAGNDQTNTPRGLAPFRSSGCKHQKVAITRFEPDVIEDLAVIPGAQ